MVSSEFTGTLSQTPVPRLASMPDRGDGVGAALRSVSRVERSLPNDMTKLLNLLDAIPDRINGCG
jgi:hypothetical protein